jgi:hypothetical protein
MRAFLVLFMILGLANAKGIEELKSHLSNDSYYLNHDTKLNNHPAIVYLTNNITANSNKVLDIQRAKNILSILSISQTSSKWYELSYTSYSIKYEIIKNHKSTKDSINGVVVYKKLEYTIFEILIRVAIVVLLVVGILKVNRCINCKESIKKRNIAILITMIAFVIFSIKDMVI